VFRGPTTLVLPAVAAIAWGALATHLCNARLLSLPFPLKLLCVVLSVAPAGTFLGMFYPLGVERVVEAGRRAAVPSTYAIATLSSVWGSAWAMTAITNLGFSAVILMGAAGYVLTGALILVAGSLASKGSDCSTP
jgi:ABC-type multidrug transport system permease subunit